jgi:hypothetical protein
MEQKADLSDIFDFTFTKFVTPIIIKIAYIIVIVMGALLWLMMIITGFATNFGAGIGGLVFGGLLFLLFILGYRIMFELVMAIFDIKKNTDRLQ